MNAPVALSRLQQAVGRAHPELTRERQTALSQQLYELNAYDVDGDGNLIPGRNDAALNAARRAAPKVASQIAKTHADRLHPSDGTARTVEYMRAFGMSTNVFEDEDDDDFPLPTPPRAA